MSNQMVERKPEWPEACDLVIATIGSATNYDAYAKMGGQGAFRRDK
jgi:translation initiation factor 2 alpha subunit (eIF-2alpha)